MTKKELINALASSTGAPRVDAERALAGLLEIITDTLKKGGFGVVSWIWLLRSPEPFRPCWSKSKDR